MATSPAGLTREPYIWVNPLFIYICIYIYIYIYLHIYVYLRTNILNINYIYNLSYLPQHGHVLGRHILLRRLKVDSARERLALQPLNFGEQSPDL